MDGVCMHAGQAHPTLGRHQGRQLYGIASFIVRGPRTTTTVKECEEAAKSSDARDKYFTVSVPSATVGGGAQLWGELPALEAWHAPQTCGHGVRARAWTCLCGLCRRLQKHRCRPP